MSSEQAGMHTSGALEAAFAVGDVVTFGSSATEWDVTTVLWYERFNRSTIASRSMWLYYFRSRNSRRTMSRWHDELASARKR